MALWDVFSLRTHSNSVVLLELNGDSVAGAYAEFSSSKTPSLHYAKRLPVKPHRGEAIDAAMFRAFSELGTCLIRDGAPALARSTGSGTPSSIVVAVGAPWQTTRIVRQVKDNQGYFTFTRRTAQEMVREATKVPEKQLLVGNSVVGIHLNGYETKNPFGKKVKRVTLEVLVSTIEETIARRITEAIRALYHTERIFPISNTAVRYLAVRHAFPHERDCLILDVTGQAIAVSLVRRGMLVESSELADGSIGDAEWLREVESKLAQFAQRYPLPRTIFVLASSADGVALKSLMTKSEFSSLWLTDNPPTVVIVQPAQIGDVRQTFVGEPDLGLRLLLLYGTHSFESMV